MLILGIETSCDETSAAVVKDGRVVLSNVVASQIALHAPFGGVVPEIASRQHVRAATHVVREALSAASVDRRDIDSVAATYGPGLAGALLVGVNVASGLALGLQVPYIPVNHLEGHVHSVWLTEDADPPPSPPLPMLVLIVSGGHTELIWMEQHGQYARVGATLDDAAGEAFDKVARLLGLAYPGGPAIQAEAARAIEPVRLPRAWLPGTYNFSFSGLKTAVLHAALKAANSGGGAPDSASFASVDVASQLPDAVRANLAAGFQDSVVDVLVTKTRRAAHDLGAASVAIVGGVAANSALARGATEQIDVPLFVAPPRYCTDNAAMIASAAYFHPDVTYDRDVVPGLSIATPA
ncbi:MAG: tRNA (adenosine(37)-N6)-threonylcarbamoyltransferase complex transferase subunit TsaD [Chloroflexota bacterium]